jgi:cytochrome c
MESFEVNKLLGALLGTVFIVMSIAIVSDGIFSSPVPEKPGYEIVAAEEPAGGEQAGGEQAAEQPIGPLLAKADPKAGEAVFKKCGACHTTDKGGANKVGPNLWGIVDRPIAAHEGFSYSAGLKAFAPEAKTWTYDHLSGFLTSPKNYVKGTVMGFGGLKKIEDRANLLAYLRTFADTPAPLPQ